MALDILADSGLELSCSQHCGSLPKLKLHTGLLRDRLIKVYGLKPEEAGAVILDNLVPDKYDDEGNLETSGYLDSDRLNNAVRELVSSKALSLASANETL
jgi:hypothetical protein